MSTVFDIALREIPRANKSLNETIEEMRSAQNSRYPLQPVDEIKAALDAKSAGLMYGITVALVEASQEQFPTLQELAHTALTSINDAYRLAR